MTSRGWTLLLRIGPAVIIAAVVLDSVSLHPLIPRNLIDDKIQHVMAFAVLAVWGFALFPRRIWTIVAALAVFGAAVEVLQAFTGRRSDFDDFTADMTGVLLGMAVWVYLDRMRNRAARK